MFNLKAKLSGTFTQVLKQRISRWAAIGKISACIVVPEDMIWWYYNEYGTANLGVKGGKTYDIPGDGGNTVMSFPGKDGARITVTHVNHPGIKASHMVGRVMDDIRVYVNQAISELIPPDYDPTQFREVLFAEIMPKVKELIAASFAEQLTGTRVDGKLLGRSASEVFAQQATFVDKSA